MPASAARVISLTGQNLTLPTTLVNLNEQQKKIFHHFIKTLFAKHEFVNIVIPKSLWLKMTNHDTHNIILKHSFMVAGGVFKSQYKNCSSIPFKLDLINLIENFFLNYPEVLTSGYLESVTAKNFKMLQNKNKPLFLLKPLEQKFHAWGLTHQDRAQLIISQPLFYQYSKENNRSMGFIRESKMNLNVAAYFFAVALLFCGMAIAFPALALSCLGGAAPFLMLAMLCATAALGNYKQAQVKPLTDLANSNGTFFKKKVTFANPQSQTHKPYLGTIRYTA